MNNCIYCGAPLDGDSQFCTNCGRKVEPQGKTCPQCGAEVSEDSAFCTKCGMNLNVQTDLQIDSQQVVTPSSPLQEEEEVVYELEKEKDRTWWYVIGGIIVVVLLAVGWYTYTHYHKSTKVENIELTSDKESFFVGLVNSWSELHNNKGFDDSANCLYAESVYFYGSKMSGIKAAQEKQKALIASKDYSQECNNIKVTKLTDQLIVCDFEKHTHSNGKNKVHPNCYLYFSNEGGDTWKIKEESDLKTDKNLLDKRTDSYEEVIIPITLQYIRDYCDHLKLPYNYWTNVENKIIKEKLNVYHYYEPLFGDPYVTRGDIAMEYKYNNGNSVLKKLSQDNYYSFCDAIGRIKDVWNVIPVKIENNDENEPPSIQFKYEGKGFEDIIINAQYIEDGREEMDDSPIYHYNYVDNSGNRIDLDFITN